MEFQVLDGKGRGYLTEVNTANQLSVRSESFSQQHDINKMSGKVWSVPFETRSRSSRSAQASTRMRSGTAKRSGLPLRPRWMP